jgi:hypothetical protein
LTSRTGRVRNAGVADGCQHCPSMSDR